MTESDSDVSKSIVVKQETAGRAWWRYATLCAAAFGRNVQCSYTLRGAVRIYILCNGSSATNASSFTRTTAGFTICDQTYSHHTLYTVVKFLIDFRIGFCAHFVSPDILFILFTISFVGIYVWEPIAYRR